MKRFFTWTGWLVLGLLLLGGGLLAHTWYFKPLSINWFYARVFLDFGLDNPEMMTQLRVLEQVGMRSHNAELTDASQAHEDRELAKLKANYATLKRYDVNGYSGQDRTSYEIFDYFMNDQVRAEPWRYHNYPVNQLFGVQSELPNLMTQIQQVNDATDAEHYIARLGQYPRKLAQVIDGIKLRESRGIVPPRLVVEKVLDQIKGFVGPGAPGNALTLGFKDKLEKIPAEKMDAATRQALLARVEKAVTESVLPAYASLASYFESLRPKATRNDGVWALPQGDQYYQYAIESNTTTTMTADQIHQLGLSEVARVGAQMDQILQDAGYVKGTRAQRMQQLAKSADQLYPDSDAGRAQVLKDYQQIIDEVTAGLGPYFNTQAKSKVEVKRVPEFTEKTAPAAYYTRAPMDGSKPGIFFANLRSVGDIPRFGMRTLAYHEAVPGHHLQISIAQEQKDFPFFRSIVPFTAYVEGWALYAEQLGWEMGFEKNPLDNLGRLQAEMFRSVRLVVDTGMHSKRWTREQAIDYMMSNTGMAEAEVVTEIERYLVMPGQALAYKVGMLKILELRERAKAALGDKFKLGEFHDQVLLNGAMPLQVLERVIDAYIARVKAG
jgi:uncharacterized protein (DUF885 family)